MVEATVISGSTPYGECDHKFSRVFDDHGKCEKCGMTMQQYWKRRVLDAEKLVDFLHKEINSRDQLICETETKLGMAETKLVRVEKLKVVFEIGL